ncbi:hypothetical protein [Mucilaginibacter arboris]|uniref:Uncharacterized protein n=1 Tax=Mucilaginibacter arboris TaxID=2682090 RepID=A0A7K1T146_9SPHI|nr:hypothetical protein [Mucilaginibacter arboris]MVN23275.1 hypothetical protein [Mucilaginibacter arboris]
MDTKEILNNANSISLEPAATEGNQSELCKIWPTAKQALEILQGLIKNPALKVIISTIIAAGDAIIGKVCN